MNLGNLTRKEKAAILKSLISVAGADNHLSYSENTYLNMFLLRIHEDQSFLNYLDTMSNDEATRIIRNFSYGDKQDLVFLWVEMATKAHGNMTGVYCINDFSAEKNVILAMARAFNIDVDIYKNYNIYF